MYARPNFRPDETPVTLAVLGANVITFVVMFFLSFGPGAAFLIQGLGVTPQSLPFRPWTFFTYPLIGAPGPLSLFSLLVVLVLGNIVFGSLERSWGWRHLLAFLLAITVINGVLVWSVSFLLHQDANLLGLMPTLTAAIVAWGWINRSQTLGINFYIATVPIAAMTFAWVGVGLLFFSQSYVLGNPVLGLVSCAGCGAAYWYIRGGRDILSDLPILGGKGRKKAPNLRFADLDQELKDAKPNRNPLRKLRDDQDKKKRDARIAEMFKNSGYEDSEENNDRNK
jgi:hypothetical protein